MSHGTGHCDTYTGLLSRVPRYEPHCTGHWSHHQVMRLTSACSLPSDRHHWSNGDCLEGKGGGKLSDLFCAILCATIVHRCAHMNRPNSSLDCILSHWAHFTVLKFILYMYYFVYHCILYACVGL